MPSFRQKMENKLRTPEQGADTLVWMCCYQDLEKMERGAFFQGNFVEVSFDKSVKIINSYKKIENRLRNICHWHGHTTTWKMSVCS